MSACIPTYLLAASLVKSGMNWSQAVLTVFLGNLIVLLPMVLNAHAGTRYGIPFPVFCRAAFGTRGANVPAVLRALVACGWFGIQTWIGGNAVYSILGVFFPGLGHDRAAAGSGHHVRAVGVFPRVLGPQRVDHLPGHRFHPCPAGDQGAAADRSRAVAAWLGVPGGGRVRADPLAALGVRTGADRRRAGSGNFSCPR